MKLAGQLGLPLCEADIEPYDVRLADEAVVYQHHDLHGAHHAL